MLRNRQKIQPCAFEPFLLTSTLVLMAMMFLGGCVDTATLRPDEAKAVGKVVVVGQLRVLHEDKDNEWSLFRPARIYIAREGRGKAFTQEIIRSDGYYFLPLLPGEYMFTGASFNNPNSWTEGQLARTSRVGARFTVPHDVESVYVGMVKIEAVLNGYTTVILDDYEMAVEAYEEKYPGASKPGQSLMELEQRIGTYQLIQNACSADWGVDCSGKFAGVTPAYPPVESNNFPVVTSLHPTFKWEASSLDDVLYDWVLYRVVGFSPMGIGGRYLPGKVVEYQQGLDKPVIQPSSPLDPGEKYYWSVRLRREGIVSNWSRFSYLNFMIFGYTSGHSSWFGFTTPGN